MKLADTPDLGSGAPRRGGSSPLIRTIFLKSIFKTSKTRFSLEIFNFASQNLVEIFVYQIFFIKFIKFIDQILTPLETKRQ